MRHTPFMGLMLCALLAGGLVGAAHARRELPAAQTDLNAIPTIVHFTANRETIPLAEVEAGGTTIELSWHAVNVHERCRLTLETYRQRAWVTLLEGARPMQQLGVMVSHPLDFAPPTYRLAIRDAATAAVIDERTVSVPYDLEAVSGTPSIRTFTALTERVSLEALQQGAARVTVAWAIDNRLPTAHLAFEQFVAGGDSVSVELPRATLWVASTGQGLVAPVLPDSQAEPQIIEITLRLFDIVTGALYDAQSVVVPVSSIAATPTPFPPPAGSPTPTPPPVPSPGAPARTPAPTEAPTGDGAARIVSFVVSPNPVDRGGTVTVSWDVQGAVRVSVWQLYPDYNFADPWFRAGGTNPVVTGLPPSGVWRYVVPADYDVPLRFELEAIDASGRRVSLRAEALALTCYELRVAPSRGECATTPPQTFAAKYQPYANGLVVWREDTATFYVLYNSSQGGTGGWRTYAGAWPPDAGAVTWDDALGAPTGAAQDYTAQLQLVLVYELSDIAYLALPDSHAVGLVVYSGIDLSAGGPAWSFADESS